MSEKDHLRIQASIGGFYGKPVTLVAVFSDSLGTLTVLREFPFSDSKLKDDMALVTNLDLPEQDWFYSETELGAAIAGYFQMKAQGLIVVKDALNRHLPDNAIEADTVDERGRNFRIKPEVENGQVAILALVAYIAKTKAGSAMSEMMDEMAEFYGNDEYTITTI